MHIFGFKSQYSTISFNIPAIKRFILDGYVRLYMKHNARSNARYAEIRIYWGKELIQRTKYMVDIKNNIMLLPLCIKSPVREIPLGLAGCKVTIVVHVATQSYVDIRDSMLCITDMI